MGFFKRLFRLPAVFLVTLWARRAYDQGVKAAEERRKRERTIVYLAPNTFRPDRLVTYTRETFRVQKKVFGYKARLLTMNTLRNGCYYHTADKYGNHPMTRRERDVRRSAFVRERLRLARLT